MSADIEKREAFRKANQEWQDCYCEFCTNRGDDPDELAKCEKFQAYKATRKAYVGDKP